MLLLAKREGRVIGADRTAAAVRACVSATRLLTACCWLPAAALRPFWRLLAFPPVCDMAEEIRILVADDHPIVRSGLVQLLRGVENFSVVGEAVDGETALNGMRQLVPDVAILDVDMPPPDGLAVARAAIAAKLPVAMIFLTMYQNESLLHTALQLGVQGYVLKNSAMEDIIEAVHAVAAGDEFVSPAMTKYLVRRSRRAAVLTEQAPAIQDLTLTERKVLKLVSEYKTSQEIAALLCVSVRTVDNHRTHIAAKLNLRGKNALLRFALQHLKELG